MVGVPAQVGAVREHRVDVAPALVVGQEDHPVAHPVGVLQLGVELAEQPAELAAAVRVDPQLAGGAAPVALPGRAGSPVLVDARAPSPRPARPTTVLTGPYGSRSGTPPSSGSAQAQTRLRNGSPVAVLATTRPSGVHPAVRVNGSPQ